MPQLAPGPGEDYFDAFPFIPNAAQGSILIISRLTTLAEELGAECLDRGDLSDDEGTELLQKTSRQQLGEEDAHTLVEKLGGQALTLTMAGRYIAETKTGLRDFINQFEAHAPRLLTKDVRSPRAYHHRSLDAALEISFNALKMESPSAAAFLLLLAMFDNKDIFFKAFDTTHLPNEVPSKYGQTLMIKPGDPKPDSVPGLDKGWLETIRKSEIAFND